MSFLQEKQSRRYFLFILFTAVFLLFSGLFLAGNYTVLARQLLYNQRQTFVSALLSQKVSPEIIAAALKNSITTQDGAAFLDAAGYGSSLPAFMISELRNTALLFLLRTLLCASAAVIILFSGTVYFLNKRELLCRKAVNIISEFSEGNFHNHLPSGGTGSIYQLFFAVEQLATALQAKSSSEHKAKEFLKDTISDISHQLKTPVSALKLYLEIILQEPDNPDTVKTFSRKAEQSLNRMEHLILILLKMMKLDAGSVQFHKENCSVEDLSLRAVTDLKTRASVEKKFLVFEGSPDAFLFCDPVWTEEALSNLVKNALDHTKEGDTVRICWKASPGLFRLSVSDTGEGILPEDLPHIFKRFYRSSKTSSAGFGLGLPLARSIIEDQGGMLFAESIPGKGSVFTISFLTDL